MASRCCELGKTTMNGRDGWFPLNKMAGGPLDFKQCLPILFCQRRNRKKVPCHAPRALPAHEKTPLLRSQLPQEEGRYNSPCKLRQKVRTLYLHGRTSLYLLIR